MVKEIEAARTVEGLKTLHGRVQDLVAHLAGTGVQTRDLVRMISHLEKFGTLPLFLPKPFPLSREPRRERIAGVYPSAVFNS